MGSATRAIKRQSFSAMHSLSVVFTDSSGIGEGAVDLGGPRREFLQLALRNLIHSNVFEGPLDSKYLTYNSAGK
jgi:hypothetical protein